MSRDLSRRERLESIIKRLDHHGTNAIDEVLRRLKLDAFSDEAIEEIAICALERRDQQIVNHRASRAHYAAQQAAQSVLAAE